MLKNELMLWLNVRRFNVIDRRTGGTGLVYAMRPCSVALSYQDNGETLKVFLTDPPIGTTPQGQINLSEPKLGAGG